MVIEVYYIENTEELVDALNYIEDLLPCFIHKEDVEMDYLEVAINAREEDIPCIERILAPLM